MGSALSIGQQAPERRRRLCRARGGRGARLSHPRVSPFVLVNYSGHDLSTSSQYPFAWSTRPKPTSAAPATAMAAAAARPPPDCARASSSHASTPSRSPSNAKTARARGGSDGAHTRAENAAARTSWNAAYLRFEKTRAESRPARTRMASATQEEERWGEGEGGRDARAQECAHTPRSRASGTGPRGAAAGALTLPTRRARARRGA